MTGVLSAVGIRPSALPAWRALADAIAEAGPVPCAGDPEAWWSDDPETRAYAARACRRCPVIAECARFATANGERFGVWGGVDRSPAVGRPPARPQRARRTA